MRISDQHSDRLAAAMALLRCGLLPLVMVAGWPGVAGALSVGDPQLHSAYFQALRVTVPVTLNSADEMSKVLSVRLASKKDYAERGLPVPALPEDALRVRQSGRGADYEVEVTSTMLIREPLLVLLLDVTAGRARVLRELPLIFDAAPLDSSVSDAEPESPSEKLEGPQLENAKPRAAPSPAALASAQGPIDPATDRSAAAVRKAADRRAAAADVVPRPSVELPHTAASGQRFGLKLDTALRFVDPAQLAEPVHQGVMPDFEAQPALSDSPIAVIDPAALAGVPGDNAKPPSGNDGLPWWIWLAAGALLGQILAILRRRDGARRQPKAVLALTHVPIAATPLTPAADPIPDDSGKGLTTAADTVEWLPTVDAVTSTADRRVDPSSLKAKLRRRLHAQRGTVRDPAHVRRLTVIEAYIDVGRVDSAAELLDELQFELGVRDARRPT